MTIPQDMSANARDAKDQLTGGGLFERRVGQAGMINPVNEIMGQGYEAQEGGDGVELTGTHRLDVEGVTSTGKEGFDGGAFVVKGKRTADTQVGCRQVGIQQRIFDTAIGQQELIDQAPNSALCSNLSAMHPVGDRPPVLDEHSPCQACCGAMVVPFQEEVAGQFSQQGPIGDTVIASIQTPNDCHARIMCQQPTFDVMQQVTQPMG